MAFDPFTLMMIAVLAIMVIFMIRNSRKQKSARDELVSKVVKGANVMTTSGIFGTILSIDEDENEILLESAPGTKLRLHRQAIASVIEKTPAVKASTAKASAAKASPTKKPTA